MLFEKSRLSLRSVLSHCTLVNLEFFSLSALKESYLILMASLIYNCTMYMFSLGDFLILKASILNLFKVCCTYFHLYDLEWLILKDFQFEIVKYS